jgi:hypothetical protein
VRKTTLVLAMILLGFSSVMLAADDADLPLFLDTISHEPAHCDATPATNFSTKYDDSSASTMGSCGPYIRNSVCQTGGWWSNNSCSQCGGGTCYYRYEGVLYYYWYGTKSCCWNLITRCSTPPSMATCNTTCS